LPNEGLPEVSSAEFSAWARSLPYNRFRETRLKMKRSLKLGGIVILGLTLAGCPAFILGSLVGTAGYAGYEYANNSAAQHTGPQAQPSAQPTLSLDDIE
jgi:hypothetical protein